MPPGLEHPGKTRHTMDDRDDISLLQTIARDRDHAALTQLAERYQNDAYNLARTILHDPAQAEDAVQEAMLSIWLTAASFRPEGSARGWILSIVTTKSLKMIRTQSRRARREEKIVMERSGSADADSPDLERGELAAALKTHIDNLPQLERQLLACCYGAGLPHQKIAELFDMSRSRVTEKIQDALSRLRGSLTKAGVAAIAPVLIEQNIFEAVTTGHTCPAGMTERLASRIAAAGRNSSRTLSRRAATRSASGKLPWIAGVTIVAAAAAGTYAWSFWNKPAATLPVVVPAPQKALHSIWKFQDGPAADLKLRYGSWQWKRQDDGTGVMDLPPSPAVVINLPMRLPQQPLKFTITKNGFKHSGDVSANILWSKGNTALKYKMYFKKNSIGLATTTSEMYLLGRHIVQFEAGQEGSILEFENPYPSDEVWILLRNIAVLGIEVKALAPDEIPASLRDVDALLKTRTEPPVEGTESGQSIPRD
jgi:RNA polymerase sigma-70 factor (ECF subfamily)